MIWRSSILLAVVTLSLPLWANAQSNAGFVQGLWYDDETVFVDEPVRIYAAIRNNTGGDLSGTVEFYVNGDRIDRKNVAALQNRIIESWTDWTPTYGTSTITATLSRTELSSTASGTRRVDVVSARTEDIIFVDYDTDKDGIGNHTDPDDDNDGTNDLDETRRGSDPLVPDPPSTNMRSSAISTTTQDTPTEANPPSGIEQYLSDSRANRALSSLTESLGAIRTQLDSYREQRQASLAARDATGAAPFETPASTTTLNESNQLPNTTGNSFGAITRTHSNAPMTFWEQVVHFITRNLENLYTFLLFSTSLFLWHPVLVQLTILLLLLYLFYRVAKKIGARET